MYLARIAFIVGCTIFLICYGAGLLESSLPVNYATMILAHKMSLILYSSTMILVSMIMLIMRK